jgi:hypothetical protein
MLATVIAVLVSALLHCLPVSWTGQMGYNVAAVISMIANGVLCYFLLLL